MMHWFHSVHFANPGYFWLLLIIPLMLIWYIFRYRKRYVELRVSQLQSIDYVRPSLRVHLRFLPPFLRMLAVAALIIALARPQAVFSEERVTTEGIDIALALDISTSMLAVDFRPNRISAAKETAIEFINERPYDRIGLVVFAGESFTQCPITLDHVLLKNLVLEADNWQLKDGTALGDGLWMGVNRLMDTTSLQSKVLILLTDGVQTAGEFAPIDAAKAASDLGIRVYTIGIGSQSNRPIPMVDRQGRTIGELDPKTSFDEQTLQQIAEMTGGAYFRATGKDKLREIYREINQLEKDKIEVNVTKRNEERFYPLAMLAALLIGLELILANTILRTLS